GWQHVRRGDSALAYPRHALEPSALEPEALQSCALLDLERGNDVGWNFGAETRDADSGAVRVHDCRRRVGHEIHALLSLAWEQGVCRISPSRLPRQEAGGAAARPSRRAGFALR